MEKTKKIKIFNMLIALSIMALGLMFCFYKSVFQTILMIAGIVIATFGAVGFIYFLFQRIRDELLLFTNGIVIVVGVLIAVLSQVFAIALPYVLLVLMVLYGIEKIYKSIAIKQLGFKYWYAPFFTGIVYSIFGIVVLCLDNTSSLFYIFCGVYLIIQSIIMLLNIFVFDAKLNSFKKDIANAKKQFKDIDNSAFVDDIVICPKCRHECSKSDKTCPNCGFNLKDDIIDVE